MSDVIINGPEDHLNPALLEGVPPEELYGAVAGYVKARDYPSARACLEKYLEQRPDNPAALHLLARVLYHQNTDFDKAEKYLNKAASLDPGSLTVYLETLGVLLIHQEKNVRAREVFEYALSEDKGKNLRHTAALKFYLDLAKKKSGGANPKHLPKRDEPKSLFFTAEYGHRRLKARFFVLPSIIAHALILLLLMYLSAHQLPFKKETQDFTYVEVGQPAGEAAPGGAGPAGEAGPAGGASPAEEAIPVGEKPQAAAPEGQVPAPPLSQAPTQSAQAPQSGGGIKLPTVPAKVSPGVQPKLAGVQMDNLPAPTAPEIKEGMEEGDSGSRGTVSAKGGAAGLAIEPGEIAAVDIMHGRKKLKIKDARSELSGGDVELSKKSLTALSGGRETAREKKYQAAKLKYKAAIAGGTMGPSIRSGQSGAAGGGPVWEKERLAKLEEQDFETAEEKPAAEKKLGLNKPKLKALAQDDIKSLPARPLKIDTGNSGQGAEAGKVPGLRSLSDMADEVPVYDKMKEELGAPMPSSGGQEGAAVSKARASMGQAEVKDQPRVLSGSDRMAATIGRLPGRRFAEVKATPGNRGFRMPGQSAASSNAGPGKSGSGTGPKRPGAPGTNIARLDEKSSAAPAGYASAGIASRGMGAGRGGYAGTAKGINGKAFEPSGSEGGLGGLMESASRKMAGALGFGQHAGPKGPLAGPSAAELKRGGVSGLASGARGGSGTGPDGRGAAVGGVRFGSAQKQSSWVSAKAPAAGITGGQPGGLTGGKRSAEGALGVPGANRYASAARAGVTPRSADRRSVLKRGTLLAENTTGPKVRIVSPYAGDTHMISQTVTGIVSDARVKKVTMTVNSDSRIISVDDGAFDASVSLVKGRNVITVMAFDMDGNVGKDSVVLDYSEPSEATLVNITSPRNGQVFDVSEKSVITVKGTVGDQDIKRAKLIFNGNPMDIVVNRGYFEQKVALSREENTLVVEATNGSGGVSHSQTVTVGTTNVKPKDIMVVLSWDKAHADLDLHIYSPSGGHTYYKQANTYESKDAIPGGQLEQDAKGNFGPEVFDQVHSERGIYTVKSNYFYSGGDGDAHAKVTIILYGDNPSRKIVRVFGPHLQRDTKDGSDTWEVTRFRMPEGIFLEE